MDSLWNFDRSVFREIHLGWHSRILDFVFWAFSTTGLDGWLILFLLVAFSDWKWFFKLRKTRNPYRVWFWPLVGAYATGGLVNQILFKKPIGRERPSNLTWAIPQESYRGDSFASGHSLIAFSVAFTILFLTLGKKNAWWGWVAMVWACGVGISRIYRGVHWPTDVLCSVFMGLFWGALYAWISSGLRQPEEYIYTPEE